MNIDLASVVSRLGEGTIEEIGASFGLSPDLTRSAMAALAENFQGGRDAAISTAAAETGLGQEVIEGLLGRLLESGRDMAVDAVSEQASGAAKGFLSRLFGR